MIKHWKKSIGILIIFGKTLSFKYLENTNINNKSKKLKELLIL